MATITPPPEGRLIEERREAQGLKARPAAGAARISPTYWRDVERGINRASDETLAKMAAVLWITPAELAGAGRDGAARELERRLETTPVDQLVGDVRALVDLIAARRNLTEGQKRALYATIMDAARDDS